MALIDIEKEKQKEYIKQIIREELQRVFKTDRAVFDKHIQILDARNIQLGKTTGTKIGTDTDQLIGFYGTTPVNQPDTVTDASDLATCITSINAIIDRLQELGLIA